MSFLWLIGKIMRLLDRINLVYCCYLLFVIFFKKDIIEIIK